MYKNANNQWKPQNLTPSEIVFGSDPYWYHILIIILLGSLPS